MSISVAGTTALGTSEVRSEGGNRENRTLGAPGAQGGAAPLAVQEQPGRRRLTCPAFFLLSCPLSQGPWPKLISCSLLGSFYHPVAFQVSNSLAFPRRSVSECVCVSGCVCERERGAGYAASDSCSSFCPEPHHHLSAPMTLSSNMADSHLPQRI